MQMADTHTPVCAKGVWRHMATTTPTYYDTGNGHRIEMYGNYEIAVDNSVTGNVALYVTEAAEGTGIPTIFRLTLSSSTNGWEIVRVQYSPPLDSSSTTTPNLRDLSHQATDAADRSSYSVLGELCLAASSFYLEGCEIGIGIHDTLDELLKQTVQTHNSRHFDIDTHWLFC